MAHAKRGRGHADHTLNETASIELVVSASRDPAQSFVASLFDDIRQPRTSRIPRRREGSRAVRWWIVVAYDKAAGTSKAGFVGLRDRNKLDSAS